MLFANVTVLLGLTIAGSQSLSPMLIYGNRMNQLHVSLNRIAFRNFFGSALYAGNDVHSSIVKSSFSNFLSSAVVFESACTVFTNQSLGATRLVPADCLTMDLCNFSNCTVTGSGSCIMFNVTATGTNSTIAVTNTFFYNSACTEDGTNPSMGGAVYCNAATVDISYCQFKECKILGPAATPTATPPPSVGGALYIVSTGIPILSYNIYRNCGMNISGWGGALFIQAPDADLANSIFSQCYVMPTTTATTDVATVASFGGALFIRNSAAVTTTAPELNLSFVEFTGCQGWNGSAVYLDGFSPSLSYTTFTNCSTAPPTLVSGAAAVVYTTSIVNVVANVTATVVSPYTIALDSVLFSETLTTTTPFYLIYGPSDATYRTATTTNATQANLYLSIPLPAGTTIDNFSSPSIPVASGEVMLLNVSSYTFTTAVWPYDIATFLDTTAVAAATATVTPSATAAPALSTVAIVFIVIAVIIVLVGIILAIVLVVRKGFGGPGGCCGRSSHVRGAKIVTYF